MDSEKLSFYTNPLSAANVRGVPLLQFASQQGYAQPEMFVLGLLQQRMRALLEAMLNSYDYGLDGREPSGRDCFQGASTSLEECMHYVSALCSANVPGLEAVRDRLEKVQSHKPKIRVSELAFVLAAFYASLPEVVRLMQPKLVPSEVPHPPLLEPGTYLKEDSTYRRTVLEVAQHVVRRVSWGVKGFYLHGSLSTLDYVKGSSDCDTFAIVKADVASSETALLDLRAEFLPMYKFLYRIDPLQHHGTMLISEQDMGFYPQPFFPLILFQYATTLWHDGKTLVFHERDSTFERTSIFLQFANHFRWQHLNQTRFGSLFLLKLYLQALLLFPALYYQAQGLYDYKRTTFPRLYDELDTASLSILTKASTIRRDNLYRVEESLPIAVLLALRNAVPGWVPTYHKVVRRIRPPQALIEFLGEQWLEEISHLADILISRYRRE